MSLIWFFALLVILFFFARWFVGLGVGAPYLPTRHRDIRDALELVPLTPQDVVVDLGSGDGRVLLAAATRGAQVIGYEINPLLVCISRFRLRRLKQVTISRKDLRRADLSTATVVFIFGITPLMPAVAEMIHHQAHPLRVISFAFDLPGFTPIAQKGITKLYQWNGFD